MYVEERFWRNFGFFSTNVEIIYTRRKKVINLQNALYMRNVFIEATPLSERLASLGIMGGNREISESSYTKGSPGSRLTSSYISFPSFTFPGAPGCWIVLLYLQWLPCHFCLVVTEQQPSQHYSNSNTLRSSRKAHNWALYFWFFPSFIFWPSFFLSLILPIQTSLACQLN